MRLLIGRKSSVQAGPISIDLLLPTSVSLEQSLRKSLCQIGLGTIQGSLQTEDLAGLVGSKRESQQSLPALGSLKLPKRTSLEINNCKVCINSKDLVVSSLFCMLSAKTVLKLTAEAKDLELKHLSEQLINLPALNTCLTCKENMLEITHSVDFLYLAIGKDLADFISGCMPVKTPVLVPKAVPELSNASTWSQNLKISSVNVSLLDTKEVLQGELVDLRLGITSAPSLEVTLTCVCALVKDLATGMEVLNVTQPGVVIDPQSVDFACTAASAHWVKSIHEVCYPPILAVIRSFSNRHQKPWKTSKPSKNVNLDFANVSAIFTFREAEALRAEVSRFQVDISAAEKLLRLSFSNSNLYITEVCERLLLTCQDLSVCKGYRVKDGESVAEIEVDGGGINLLVPELYPWGRAVFKSTINIVGAIKWTLSFLFPGIPKIPHISFMEKAVTTLTLSKVKVIIMDGVLHNSIRKKLQIRQESDIYPQLKSLPDAPFLILEFEMTTGLFDNTKLRSVLQALSALQEIDPFEVPGEDYFSFIMANDMKMVFSGCSGQLRDYPWKLYKVSKLILKGRSMVTKNRLPLHNWSRWKIHSNMGIRLKDVEFTFGLCLRSSLMDVRDIADTGAAQEAGDKKRRPALHY